MQEEIHDLYGAVKKRVAQGCRAVLTYYYSFRYRKEDPDICCCGSRMGHGGSICYHGGCRSMKDYTIGQAVENAISKFSERWPKASRPSLVAQTDTEGEGDERESGNVG